ncbi:FUSC family protein [Streptomyces hesseae]|uniref:FUSC family protein n=1 Tax=Streptomyces hesseae TaxID=3075519 RepID=A0ABU2SH36_9ACTN|nr:FUSC family protein [Streptomyces sp. DSM 40473]MDT0447946.1 FUSC family protein [Streptomyces sp. DSM 40473]
MARADIPPAARRAVWATLAGCAGFYGFAHALGDHTLGLYAIFGVLPLVLFSQIPGPARRRTRTLLAMVPVGWVMVTAGTLLAVRGWAAAAGMFVVGFLVAFAATAGPGPAGLSVACQLFYVLPCFPPYAPGTLGSRLAGLTAGILLTAAVDRLLDRLGLREPPPVPYRVRLGRAAAAVADSCATAARGGEDLRPAADRALEGARPSRIPPAERPTSPSARDRALNHTRACVRHVHDQLDRLYRAPGGPDGPGGPRGGEPAATALLEHTATALRPVATGLTGGTPPPDGDELHRAVAAFDALRADELPGAPPERLRHDAVVRSAAEGARLAGLASRIALGARATRAGAERDGPFWYAAVPAPLLWWHRMRVHLTLRSVHLQNALRVATAMAGARLLVGALDLSHGFWVLLATLSLMRTSAADTRTALRPAITGTTAGAVLAAVALRVVGDVPLFYAAVLPVVLLVGFTAAPLLGPAWGQATFTVVIVLMFAQISTPQWQLSAARLVDVLVGGAIGVLASLLAWPRGAGGELRCAVADFLAAGAAGCRGVTDLLCGRPAPADPLRPVRVAMLLAEASYCQYQSERLLRRTADPPWWVAMLAGYHMLRGAELMLLRHGAALGATPLAPDAAAELGFLADRVADDALRAAEALRAPDTARSVSDSSGPAPAPHPAATSGLLRSAALHAGHVDAARVLLTVDAEAWLTGVAEDIARIAHTPYAPPAVA